MTLIKRFMVSSLLLFFVFCDIQPMFLMLYSVVIPKEDKNCSEIDLKNWRENLPLPSVLCSWCFWPTHFVSSQLSLSLNIVSDSRGTFSERGEHIRGSPACLCSHFSSARCLFGEIEKGMPAPFSLCLRSRQRFRVQAEKYPPVHHLFGLSYGVWI